jgi:hypothetical protein
MVQQAAGLYFLPQERREGYLGTPQKYRSLQGQDPADNVPEQTLPDGRAHDANQAVKSGLGELL